MRKWKRSFPKMSEQTGEAQKSANIKKLLSTLGLCARAGKVIYGVPMICDGMRRSKGERPVTVFEASDTSENTHKKITDKCVFYKVKHIRLDCDGASLAAALGKTSSLGAVAVTDEKMSGMVEKYI